jgi:hypothetical protein
MVGATEDRRFAASDLGVFGQPCGPFDAIVLQEESGGSFQFLRYIFIPSLSLNCLESQISG